MALIQYSSPTNSIISRPHTTKESTSFLHGFGSTDLDLVPSFLDSPPASNNLSNDSRIGPANNGLGNDSFS